ncbi:glycosyltransferase family 4 protein [Wenyingzhuangia sp. IMCC45574]
MKIGIAAPIEVYSLKEHFSHLSEFDLSLGLGGTAVNIIIDGLLKAGHQVTVFTLDTKVRGKHVIEGAQLKIIFGAFRAKARFKTLDFCYKEFKQIQSFIKQEGDSLDVINAHWSYEFAIGALLVYPNKTIVTFRDDAPSILKILKHPYRVTRLCMDAWVRKKAKFKTYNSPYLSKLIGLKGEVIGNPIFDDKLTAPRKLHGTEEAFKICFIANGTDFRKNPHTAVKAFQLIKKKHTHTELFFIGKGYEAGGELAKEYHQIKGIHFLGFQKHEYLLERLKEFDLMLHTALEESFGNNLIEAMAKGMPVVAGKTAGAVPWVLDKGRAGVLVNITNPTLIAKAIDELIDNVSVYNTYSKRGFENVKERFSQSAVCEKYIEVYKKIYL